MTGRNIIGIGETVLDIVLKEGKALAAFAFLACAAPVLRGQAVDIAADPAVLFTDSGKARNHFFSAITSWRLTTQSREPLLTVAPSERMQ